jgi:hypothetical protein
LNGKMDLTEVEGLVDILSAETEAQREQALLQMEGHLGKIYKTWAGKLTEVGTFMQEYIAQQNKTLFTDRVWRLLRRSLIFLKMTTWRMPLLKKFTIKSPYCFWKSVITSTMGVKGRFCVQAFKYQ